MSLNYYYLASPKRIYYNLYFDKKKKNVHIYIIHTIPRQIYRVVITLLLYKYIMVYNNNILLVIILLFYGNGKRFSRSRDRTIHSRPTRI